ncbi:hypothetical protein HDU99_007712, partial [Rhizoclosmatium hyalinum]
MPLKVLKVTSLPPSQRQEALDQIHSLLAQEFTDSDIYKTLYFSTTHRHQVIPWFLSKRLLLNIHNLYIAVDNTLFETGTLRVLGHASVSPPGAKGMNMPGLWQLLTTGFLLFPVYFGAQSFQRFFDLTKAWDPLMEDATRGKGVYGAVELVVVREDQRGKGVGTELVKEAVDLAWKGNGEGVLVLTTQEERNVRFYERAGFKVVSEGVVTIPKGVLGSEITGVQNWVMEK